MAETIFVQQLQSERLFFDMVALKVALGSPHFSKVAYKATFLYPEKDVKLLWIILISCTRRKKP